MQFNVKSLTATLPTPVPLFLFWLFQSAIYALQKILDPSIIHIQDLAVSYRDFELEF